MNNSGGAVEMPRIYLAGLHGEIGSLEITVDDLGRRYDLTSEEIRQRTGVTRLFRFGPGETLISASVKAARALLSDRSARSINLRGLFASSNTTIETLMPGFATSVGSALGFTNMLADQIGMGCAGGMQALRAAYDRLVVHGLRQERASYLVLAGDATSLILDDRDLTTGIIFSEGVAAMLVTNDVTLATAGYEIVRVGTKSLLGDLNTLRSLRVDNPYWPSFRGHLPFFTMEGKSVFKFGADILPHFLELIGAEKVGDDWMLFPHQANRRMLEAMARRGGIPESQVYMDGIGRIGNTSPAAVFLGLEDGLRRELYDIRQTVLLGAFGAELMVGAALLKPIGNPSLILR